MKFNEALFSLTLKFTSGNSIDVERATITREEWEALLTVIVSPAKPTVQVGEQ